MGRAIRAVLLAAGSFVVVGVVACAGFTYSVRNSQDGQAGMGAAFGGFYAGVLAAVITFVVSFVRNSPSRIAKRESSAMSDQD